MSKSILITGLDIGSSKISAVTAEMGRPGAFRIVAETTSESKGVSRGVITDLNQTTRSISKTLGRIKDKIAVNRLDDIYVNISGENIKAEKSKGMIPLSMRGREVAKGDIDRCVNVASTIQLPFDMDIIHRVIQNFSIDDQPCIKNPLGLYASRLACEMYVLSANVSQVQNIYKCVNDAGYDVKEIIFTGIAEGSSVLSAEEKEAGAVILNIGASLTEASIFSGGILVDMRVIGMGTRDFKGELKDSPELHDVFSKVKARIDDFSNRHGAIGFIALTGGLAFSDDIIELLENRFSCPVKIGIARDIKGDISGTDSIRLAVAIGLVRYGEAKYKAKLPLAQSVVQQISTKVVDIFNNYF